MPLASGAFSICRQIQLLGNCESLCARLQLVGERVRNIEFELVERAGSHAAVAVLSESNKSAA